MAEIGSYGMTYLFGLLGLVACLALALFGSSWVARYNARVVGLATAGGLLVILTASASTLGPAPDHQLLYGLTEGFLVGRLISPPAGPDGQSDGSPERDRPTAGWRRRRAEPDLDPAEGHLAASDLTVTSAAPFARSDPDH